MKIEQIENLLGALALSITDSISSKIMKEIGNYGSDIFALILLYQDPNVKVDILARELKLAQSSAVRLIDRLEKSCLIKRTPGQDKRVVEISLTALGEIKAEQILQSRQEKLNELVHLLTKNEQLTLGKISKKLLNHLTTDLQSAEHNCRLCNEEACNLCQCPVEQKYNTFDGAIKKP